MKILEKTNLFCFRYRKGENEEISTLELVPHRLLSKYQLTFIGLGLLCFTPQIYTISPNHSLWKKTMVRSKRLGVLQDGIFDTANEIFRNSVVTDAIGDQIIFFDVKCEAEFHLIQKYKETRIDFSKSLVIGIATANTPCFNSLEQKKLVALLNELYLAGIRSGFDIIFRAAEQILDDKDIDLNIENTNLELECFLNKIDILISTKSTIIFDALNKKIPVVEIRHRSVGSTLALMQVWDVYDIRSLFNVLKSNRDIKTGFELCQQLGC